MSREVDEMKTALSDNYGPAEKKPLIVKVNISWLWKMFKKFKKYRRRKRYEN